VTIVIAHPGHKTKLLHHYVSVESCYTGITCPPRDLSNGNKLYF